MKEERPGREVCGLSSVVFSPQALIRVPVMFRSTAVMAGDVLASVDLDDGLIRSVLPRVNPERVRIRVGPIWFRAVWGRRIAAVALPWGIYVRPPVMNRLVTGAEPLRNTKLIVHELVHIEQWRRFGAVSLIVRYLGDYLHSRIRGKSHWEAYRGVRTEVEARAAACLIVGRILPS